MKIERKMTSALTDEEITALSEILNEALYRKEEPLGAVRKLFFSHDRGNSIIYDSGKIVGIVQYDGLKKNNTVFTEVAAISSDKRGKGLISEAIDVDLQNAKSDGVDYAAAPIGNPAAMCLFYDKGFLLPTKMGEEKDCLLNKAKEILVERYSNDMGLTESFVIPHKNYIYPDLRNNGEAYRSDVADFVKNRMSAGDRLFMIKEL
jgi:hypothetical protein